MFEMHNSLVIMMKKKRFNYLLKNVHFYYIVVKDIDIYYVLCIEIGGLFRKEIRKSFSLGFIVMIGKEKVSYDWE